MGKKKVSFIEPSASLIRNPQGVEKCNDSLGKNWETNKLEIATEDEFVLLAIYYFLIPLVALNFILSYLVRVTLLGLCPNSVSQNTVGGEISSSSPLYQVLLLLLADYKTFSPSFDNTGHLAMSRFTNFPKPSSPLNCTLFQETKWMLNTARVVVKPRI